MIQWITLIQRQSLYGHTPRKRLALREGVMNPSTEFNAMTGLIMAGHQLVSLQNRSLVAQDFSEPWIFQDVIDGPKLAVN